MRIFSNFDTQFKQKTINKSLSSFRKEEVIVISRSKYYFVFRVLFPCIILMGFGIVVFYFLQTYSINWYVSVPLGLAWALVIWFRVGHKLLKFHYDFTVIDPLGVTTYKQKGIMHSFLKQIPANRIRSIQVCRNNISENIFGYGSLDILTDFADNMHIGEENEAASVIGMTYVDNPYSMKNRITDICFK